MTYNAKKIEKIRIEHGSNHRAQTVKTIVSHVMFLSILMN